MSSVLDEELYELVAKQIESEEVYRDFTSDFGPGVFGRQENRIKHIEEIVDSLFQVVDYSYEECVDLIYAVLEDELAINNFDPIAMPLPDMGGLTSNDALAKEKKELLRLVFG